MFKTMLGQEWYEKVKSIEKSQTPKERYLKALQLRADLEKLQHDDIRLKASSYYEWKEYEKLLSLVDAEVLCRKAGIGVNESKDAISLEPDMDIHNLIIGKDKPMWSIPKDLAGEIVTELGIFKENPDDILSRYFAFKCEPETRGVIENEPKIINGHPKPIGFLPEVIHQLFNRGLLIIGQYNASKYAFVKDFFIGPKGIYNNRILKKQHAELGRKHKEKIEQIIASYYAR